jgi:O-antigen ligase
MKYFMNNFKKYLSYNNFAVFLLSIYPLALALGSLVSEFLNFVIIFFFLTNIKKNEIIKIVNNKIFIFCIVIWLYFIINLAFSNFFYVSFPRAIFFVRFIFLFISIIYLLNIIRDKLSYVIFFWTIFFSFIYIDLLIQYFFNRNLFNQVSPWPGRLSGIMGLKLKIAHLIIGFVPLIIGFFYQKKKFILSLSITFLTCLMLIIINERSNTLRFFFITFLFFLFIKNYNLRFKVLFFASIIFLFFTIVFFSKGEYSLKQRYWIEPVATFNNKSIIASLKDTVYGAHYFTAMKIFENYPLLGSGIRTFRIECFKEIYDDKSLHFNNQRCSTHPHQIYFEILSELGIIGFVVFFGLFFLIIFEKIANFFKNNNYQSLGATLYVLVVFLPLLPSGSFFVSFGATIFWINFSFMVSNSNEQ